LLSSVPARKKQKGLLLTDFVCNSSCRTCRIHAQAASDRAHAAACTQRKHRTPKAEKASPENHACPVKKQATFYRFSTSYNPMRQKGFAQFPQGFPQADRLFPRGNTSFRFWKFRTIEGPILSTERENLPQFLKILPTLRFFLFFCKPWQAAFFYSFSKSTHSYRDFRLFFTNGPTERPP